MPITLSQYGKGCSFAFTHPPPINSSVSSTVLRRQLDEMTILALVVSKILPNSSIFLGHKRQPLSNVVITPSKSRNSIFISSSYVKSVTIPKRFTYKSHAILAIPIRDIVYDSKALVNINNQFRETEL